MEIWAGIARLGVVEGTLVIQLPIPHEARHHRQCAGGE
jgi:hypothetical protein